MENQTKEYYFEFFRGGWNSVFATSMEEARQIIDQLYGDRLFFKVNEKTIRLLDNTNLTH